MRHVTGPASLDVPDELRDRTSYVFEARMPPPDPREESKQPDRITVLFEELSERVAPADMVKHRRARIEELPGATSTITEADIKGVFVDARALFASVDASGERFNVYFAAFRWSPRIMGHLNLEAPSDKNYSAEFTHVAGSVHPSSIPQAPAPGYVERYAGAIAIDVPLGFRWPKNYLFKSDDEKVRLLITSDDNEPEPIDVYSLVELEGIDDELIEIPPVVQERPVFPGLRAEETWLRVERRQTSTGAVLDAKVIRRLVTQTPDRGWLAILLVDDADAPRIAQDRWEAMLSSLTPSGQVP